MLPDNPDVVWEVPLAHAGLGGIAANDKYVIFGDRDQDDFQDVYRCLDAATGKPVWEIERLAAAALDYGNSPRATPLIVDSKVICQGAMGNLLCIDLLTGDVLWEKNFRDEFPVDAELPWGYCGSPLLADGKLIVAPGAPDASLIALDPSTGALLWKVAGLPPSHGSLIVAELGGIQQVVGHDQKTLGGWDLSTGKRLWTIKPHSEGDFNVPTPVIYPNQQGEQTLLVATENNGLRSIAFDNSDGTPSKTVFTSMKLRTDMSTPIVVGEQIYCVKDFLYCFDVSDLSEKWRIRDRALGDYAATFATDEHLLVVGKGDLLLLRSDGTKKIISRCNVFDEHQVLYSHPAIYGNRMYIRGEHQLKCLRLPPNSPLPDANHETKKQ
jgi:outer membrane protein assembly factor BamB